MILIFTSMLTLSYKYKLYKETYLLLKNKEYTHFIDDNERILVFYDNNKSIYWNKLDSTVKLTDNYIFNNYVTKFDPYTLYWKYKLKKEFFNVTKTIEEIRDEKLNKILKNKWYLK